MRTSYDKLITEVLENNNAERHSTAGIGLDFKTVYYYIFNEDGTKTGAYSVGGATYKDCYNELCRKIASYGSLKN